ncbi:MAG: hypothetical protein P8J66_05240, partial [Verrucomicrobiota bacterium]|nr:hypothetical protein [Verrucomicrobiota bacterium]
AIRAEAFTGDGVDAKWIVYGDFLGDQKCSILRLIVEPGGKTNFCPESPALFHTNGGCGRVGKLEVRYHQDMKLGEIYPEIGFITQAALASGGVEIENTGTEPLVLTFDFPQHAHSQTPGVADTN